jgi:hypothetical protein
MEGWKDGLTSTIWGSLPDDAYLLRGSGHLQEPLFLHYELSFRSRNYLTSQKLLRQYANCASTVAPLASFLQCSG